MTDPADGARGKRRQRSKPASAVSHERALELVEISD
jgi:hypothetical protein